MLNPRSLRHLVCASALMLMFANRAVSNEPVQIDQAQVDEWVEQMSSDSYSVRESATSSLMKAGKVAVDAVSRVVVSGDLESVTRGIYVLRELALSDDVQTELAARAALEEIAEAKVTAAAKRAKATLAKLNQIRQAKAIRTLKTLGARVHQVQNAIDPFQGVVMTPRIEAEIDSVAWRGTDKDFEKLRFLAEETSLILVGDKVTDTWMKTVNQMPRLTSLSLNKPKISAAGLRSLAQAPELQELSVSFSSAVKDETIDSFIKIKKLTKLRLYGALISNDAEQKLRNQLAAELDIRKGGLLGIVGSDPAFGAAACEIQYVQVGSAAEKAGLVVGDVIVEFNGQPITNFRELTEKIAKFPPGEKVKLVTKRGGTVIPREVELGSWENVTQATVNPLLPPRP